MTPHRHTRRPGFTLLELGAVLVCLGVLLTVGTAVVAGALRLNRTADASGRRVIWRGYLADQFRADAGRAVAAPDALGDLTAGPDCLVLKTAAGTHVVYRWADGQLTRFERTDGADTPRPLPWLPPSLAGEFVRSLGIVTLRLTEPQKHGQPRRADVVAALGGDRP